MSNNGGSPDRRLSSSLAAPILLLLISASIGRNAAQVPTGIETIFIVPGSHLDVGFTDTPTRVSGERIHSNENAVQAAERDPEFRWFEEGGWSLNAWLQQYGRDERRIALAFGYAVFQRGDSLFHLQVPLLHLLQLDGIDALLRL